MPSHFNGGQSSVNSVGLPTGIDTLIYKQVILIEFKLSTHTNRELTPTRRSPCTENSSKNCNS